jgi:hypothetical protein
VLRIQPASPGVSSNTVPPPPPGQGTAGYGLNPAGDIVGYYVDASNVNHGFLRNRDGSFITFDAPGAGTGLGQGTSGLDVNPGGLIAGWYADSSGVYHAFLRATDGRFTTFDAPGAGTGPGQGTYMTFGNGLTPSGEVSGNYLDSSNV